MSSLSGSFQRQAGRRLSQGGVGFIEYGQFEGPKLCPASSFGLSDSIRAGTLTLMEQEANGTCSEGSCFQGSGLVREKE